MSLRLHLPLLLLAGLSLAACQREQAEPSAPPAPAADIAAQPEPPATEEVLADPVSAALEQAMQQQRAVLVDFHAPWCYSCYFMASHVLTGAEWLALNERVIHVELDADSPLGARYQQQWAVKAMPSYILLDSQGAEIGRILGEQSRNDFYSQLNGWLDDSDPLDSLRKQAQLGDIHAITRVLQAYAARDDASGLEWFGELPLIAKESAVAEQAVNRELARLQLARAASANDAKACADTSVPLFAGPLQCADIYALDRLMGCVKDAQSATAPSVLQGLEPRFVAFAEAQRQDPATACADQRSIVLTTSELLTAVGKPQQGEALLERAIADLRPQIEADPRRDRNLADNLRVYLQAAGNEKALDEWQLQLIAAWPEDYVYSYRHGRNLLQRGKAEKALPFLEQAARSAYGVNRLQVAQLRVQALIQLKRTDEARAVIGETLRANGPWFPEQAAQLKALLPS